MKKKTLRFLCGFLVRLQSSSCSMLLHLACIASTVPLCMRVYVGYSPNRPSGMNEMQCDTCDIYTSTAPIHLQPILCCIIRMSARARVRAHSRSPLYMAGVVYFLLIPFSSLFGKNKIQKKKKRNMKTKDDTRVYFFPFNVRRAHVMVCLHTKFRCVRHTTAR